MTTRNVTIELPESVAVTLRGHARSFLTADVPTNVIVALFEKGVQRGANDPLGAVFDKGQKVSETEIDTYWNDLVKRWNSGQVAKTRVGGLGRTTDPVLREVKRLAKEEVIANIATLLEHHKVSRKEFESDLLAKYVSARVEKYKERLTKEAEANLAKLKRSADVELLDLEAPAEADESEEDESEAAE